MKTENACCTRGKEKLKNFYYTYLSTDFCDKPMELRYRKAFLDECARTMGLITLAISVLCIINFVVNGRVILSSNLIHLPYIKFQAYFGTFTSLLWLIFSIVIQVIVKKTKKYNIWLSVIHFIFLIVLYQNFSIHHDSRI